MSEPILDMLEYAIRNVISRDPEPVLRHQALYQAIHAWALRGMGYGLGDHPETSGERGVLEVLARRCTPPRDPVIFDVGANVGDYATLAWNTAGDNAIVHCFEPSASARRMLESRVPDAELHPFGLSDDESVMPLHTDELGSGMASVHPRRIAHFGRALNVEERAELRRLDSVCRELNVTRIDLLKLDVEGHELAVLRGAGDMLTSGAIRMIQWEMGGSNLDSRTTFQDFWYLLSGHFDLFRVVADGLVPVPRYREELEVFICANFVAIWRER